jgi:hypothetical protein
MSTTIKGVNVSSAIYDEVTRPELSGTQLAKLTKALDDSGTSMTDFVRRLAMSWTEAEIIKPQYQSKGGPAQVSIKPDIAYRLAASGPNPSFATTQVMKLMGRHGGNVPLWALADVLLSVGFKAASGR